MQLLQLQSRHGSGVWLGSIYDLSHVLIGLASKGSGSILVFSRQVVNIENALEGCAICDGCHRCRACHSNLNEPLERPHKQLLNVFDKTFRNSDCFQVSKFQKSDYTILSIIADILARVSARKCWIASVHHLFFFFLFFFCFWTFSILR